MMFQYYTVTKFMSGTRSFGCPQARWIYDLRKIAGGGCMMITYNWDIWFKLETYGQVWTAIG